MRFVVRQGRRRTNRDRGASLVEFAMIAPFLILLLLGIVEFSWAFAGNLDVRHGAREGARLTAVDVTGSNVTLGAEICGRMDLVGGDATITWTADPTDFGNIAALEVGDGVVVSVATPFNTLTGIIDWAFPASLTTLDSTVEIRIEQNPTWSDGSYDCATGVFA
jgi:hypothetical protein